MTSLNQNKYNDAIVTIWRYVLFISFYLLCLRFIFSSFYQANTSQLIQLVALLLVTAGLTLYSFRLALFSFIASIPLISGLQILGIFKNPCILSFFFSSIYIAWLPKTIIYKKSALRANSAVSVCIDLITTIVLLSLAHHLIVYPSSITIPALLYSPVITQVHDMQGITASFVFLQGCFLFLLLEIEHDVFRFLQFKIIKIFCIQAVTILFFSGVQLLFNVPARSSIPLTANFQDSHVLSTYSAFLLFFFLNFSSEQKFITKTAFIALALLFSVLAVLACGRIELAASLFILMVLLFYKISLKKYMTTISLIFAILLIINLFPHSPAPSTNLYFDRLKGLLSPAQYFNTSNGDVSIRFFLWKRAVDFIMHAPLTGIGMGAFYKPSPNYMLNDPAFPLSQYPHNYFLQLAAEIGIPGIVIFLLIIFLSFKIGCAEMQSKTSGTPFIKTCLCGLGLYVFTFITGHHLILPVHQFLFWFIVAGIVLQSSSESKPTFTLSGYHQISIILLFTLLFITYMVKDIKSDRSNTVYGNYLLERSASDTPVYWTAKESSDEIVPQSNLLMIRVAAQRFNIDDSGLFFKLFINDNPVLEHHFYSPQERAFYCYVPDIAYREITIKTWVDKIFCPKNVGLNNDSRELGILLRPVAWLVDIVPKEGIGFYNWETWGEPPSSDWPENVPVRVRWTNLRASMDIQNYSNRGMIFFLLAAHPNMQQFPVAVKITGDNAAIIKEELFDHRAWKKVILTPEELKGSTSITFEVSRTWNPKLSGVSKDKRDLGIAVAIPEQWHADLERTLLPDLSQRVLHDQKDRALATNLMPAIQMAMDFSRIIKEKNVRFALSGLTGQKAKIRGTATIVDGPKKGSHALLISGKPDDTMVYCSPLEINPQEGSLALWARLEDPLKKDSRLIDVVSQNRSKIISIEHNGSDGGFSLYYNNAKIVKGASSIKDTNWHHYVFTWKNREQLFYIDGKEVLSSAKEASTEIATRLHIGGRPLNQWHGAIASFFTFNRNITKAELNFLYRNWIY